jgi:hypothetical protein
MRPPLHVGCKVDDCDRKHLARGYCNLHYKREIVRPGRRSNWAPFKVEDRIEDCQWMAEHGETLTGAAKRIGIGRPALEAWLAKHDPPTLRVLRSRDNWPEESRATFHGVAS